MSNNALKLEDISVTDLLSEQEYDEQELQEEESAEETTEETSEETTEEESTEASAEESTEEAANEQVEGEESVISQISEALGYEVEGEFDESIEGITNYTKKVADHIANEKLNGLFTKFPMAYEFIKHLSAGGKPEKFSLIEKEPDFVTANVDEASDDTLKAIIRESLSKQGYEEEDIDESIGDYEDTGLLKKQGKLAQSYLKKYFTKEKQRQQKEAEAEEAKIEAERSAAVQEIKTTISSGALAADFMIPTKEKKEFENWMFVAKQDGKTQRDIERESMSIQEKLALEYLFFKKFKLNDIVQKKAASLNADKLRDRIKSLPKKASLGTQRPSGKKNQQEIPSFDDIFSD